MSTIIDNFNDGYDAVCLMMGGVLYVGDTGKQVLKAQTLSDLPFSTSETIAPTRKKSEVVWTGINLTIPTGTNVNLVETLKSLTPTSGTLVPFFRISDNKLHCINEDATLNFKLNLIGSWSSASTNLSMRVTFVGTVGNTNYQSRTPAITTDVISFEQFISVDKNGNMAKNGATVNLVCNGAEFTATQILLIAEQVTVGNTML